MTVATIGARAASDDVIPRDHTAIVEVAVSLLFPFLIFGTALVQQPWTLAHDLGQVMLWLAILAAAEVVYVLQRAEQTLLVIGAMIVGLRVASAALGAPAAITSAYELVSSLLFVVAGAAVIQWRPWVLERQLRRFLLVSIPFMAAQLVGWPEWTQAWRTDAHGDATTSRVMVRTLFEREGVEGFPALQARPAGVLHANNFLSIVVLFAMAFLFERSRGEKLKGTDVAIVVVLVLAMAKILFLAFLVFTILYLVRGPRSRRLWLLKLWGVFVTTLGVYFLFFPSVFLFDLSPNNALLNYALRVADLRAVLGGLAFSDVSVQGLDGTTLEMVGIPAGSQSAVAAAARHLSLLLILVPVVSIAYFQSLRVLRRRDRDLGDLAVNGALMILLAMLITSFMGNVFFAFAAAMAALPWLAPRLETQR